MPCRLITHVQRVMFLVVMERSDRGNQFAMLFPDPALRAVRLELLDRHSHRHTCPATVAIRAVGEYARATEARLDEIGVDVGVDQMTGCVDLRARDAPV